MNSATLLLLRFHAAARLRRLQSAFSNRRRLLLTLAALLFGIVWLGQTVAIVLFRKPYDPQTFHRWTSLVLMGYFSWHLIRVAYKRPDEAIEWSTAEAAHIVGGPFTRRDVLKYRLVVILTSTLPKALVTAFVLLPDLWWSGLPGLILALVFLECVRTVFDIAVCCLSRRSYLIARMTVFGLILLLATLLPSARPTSVPVNENTAQWLSRATATVQMLRSHPVTTVVERPFVLFADIITAQRMSVGLLINTSAAVVLVAFLMWLIIRLDRLHQSLTRQRQTRIHASGIANEQGVSGRSQSTLPLPAVPRLRTIGPVVWRQWKSAMRYKGSLIVALAIPAVLSFGPFFSVPDPTFAFLVLVGTVVFYSFVLLPEAIKFDFRLDCDHLAQLKLLPITPLRMVIGQLAMPILVATLFQVSLFVFAGAVRSVSPTLVISAILLTVPINGLFAAIDNLIFLLYPHRPTQEGFEAFLRTMLKFTFKSVLLGIAGAVVFGCAIGSRLLVDAAGVPHLVQWVFVGGMVLIAWLSAALSIALVTRAFAQFDVSLSVPS